MKKSNMYQLNKKVWALMMVAVMIVTMIPLVAFADSEQTGKQIGAYFEVNDATGELQDNPTSGFTSGTEQSYEDGKVKVNKTITPTEQENVFNIDLTVSTQEKITSTTTSADAAAVIVIDCSFSMYECMECGHKHGGSSETLSKQLDDCDSCNCTADKVKPRYIAAQEAAQAFINSFAEAGVVRKVAVVKFSGYDGEQVPNAKTMTEGWEDVASLKTDGNAIVHEKIKALVPDGGTNIEAGLMLARNLLSDPLTYVDSENVTHTITNKNVILLTDGQPTYGVDRDITSKTEIGSEYINGSGSYTTCGNGRINYGFYYEDYGDTHVGAQEIAEYIKSKEGLNANTYAIYVGDEEDTLNCQNCNAVDGKCSEWLGEKGCKFATYTADDISGLISTFEGIADLIALKAQAWIVEDPMGENIEFVSWDVNGNNKDALTAPEDNDNVLEWNIKDNWLPVEKTETEDEVKTYTYKLSYQIRLDTLADNYEAGKYYAANGVTSLLYYIENTEGGETTATTGTAYFNVPSVKGFAGNFEFNKVNNFGEKLAGAEFKLTHKNCSCNDKQAENAAWAIAESGANGAVQFADVPSGHKYVLTETKAPDGYVADSKEYEVTVSYGIATVTGMTDNNVVNNPVTTDVVVAKKVTGTLGDVNKEFKFKATALDRNGNVYTVPAGEGYTVSDDNVIEFTLKHGEVITIKDLPVGATLQIEETNALGYDKVMSAVDTKGTATSEDDTAIEVTPANNGGSLIVKDNLKVTVTNDKNPLIDTGFTDNINVYLIMILIAAIAAISVVLYKTRRREA